MRSRQNWKLFASIYFLRERRIKKTIERMKKKKLYMCRRYHRIRMHLIHADIINHNKFAQHTKYYYATSAHPQHIHRVRVCVYAENSVKIYKNGSTSDGLLRIRAYATVDSVDSVYFTISIYTRKYATDSLLFHNVI